MSDQPERAGRAVSVPMNSGAGMSPAMGVAAPIGAVSRKDLQRAAKTSVRRAGAELVLTTALPGNVALQRRGRDGAWDTLAERSTSRLGRTRIELPQDDGAPPAAFRVVFSPKNANIAAWVSEDFGPVA